MSIFFNATGTPQKVKEVWFNATGTPQRAKEVWFNATGTPQRVWPDYAYDGGNFYGQLQHGIIANNFDNTNNYLMQIFKNDGDSYEKHKYINTLNNNNMTITSGAIQVKRAEIWGPSIVTGQYGNIYNSWTNFISKDKISFNEFSGLRISGSYEGSGWHTEETPITRICSLDIGIYFCQYEKRNLANENTALIKKITWGKSSTARTQSHNVTGQLSGNFNETLDISNWTNNDYLLCNLVSTVGGDGYSAEGNWGLKITNIEFII